MQYLLLVFEIVFFTGPVISRMALIGGGHGVGWWGWVASRRRAITAIRAQTVVLCSQQTSEIVDVRKVHKPQDRSRRHGHWQQFGTQPILISAPQWACWPCNAPTRPYTVGKKPSLKAGLAIYIAKQLMSMDGA